MGNAFNATSHLVALGALCGGCVWDMACLEHKERGLTELPAEVPDLFKDYDSDAEDEDTPLVAGLKEMMKEELWSDDSESDQLGLASRH